MKSSCVVIEAFTDLCKYTLVYYREHILRLNTSPKAVPENESAPLYIC
jgi:hypothetical protein